MSRADAPEISSARVSEARVRVTVVIVAWNSGPHLQRTLDHLAQQSLRDFDVLLWDNNSTDGCVDGLALAQNVTLVRSPENLGFAGGMNRAIERARGQFVALLNPDAFPEPDWLAEMLATQARTGAVSVGAVQVSEADEAILDGAGDVMSITGIAWRGGVGHRLADHALADGRIFSPCGAAALYQRDVFLEMGGFDERYFCYFEDVDLGFRLWLAGRPSWLSANARMAHVGSATLGRYGRMTLYYGTRNRIFTFAKCMPLVLWPLALPLFVVMNLLSLAKERRPETWRGRWDGCVDGLRGAWPFVRENFSRRKTLAQIAGVARAFSWSPWALARRDIRVF